MKLKSYKRNIKTNVYNCYKHLFSQKLVNTKMLEYFINSMNLKMYSKMYQVFIDLISAAAACVLLNVKF